VTARGLLFAIAAAAATAIGVAAGLYFDAAGERAPEIGGYVLERPRALPPIALVDEQAAPFRAGDFAGHWSFLYFGYTYCPDVCPLTLVELAELKRRLASERPDERVEYYLISVDPQRDTPARLREYAAYFDPALRGLTGSHAALAAMAQATDTVFDVPAGQDANNYLVSHSSNLVVLDPDGAVHAVLKPPHDPARLAADFTRIAAHYASHR
jgi:protein SCO1/2